MAQAVKCLPSKCKTLSSNPSTERERERERKNEKKRERERKEGGSKICALFSSNA
jgi:hypothetical protein